MRIYYQLTTIDPVIISQSNATTNNHDCLDYIPGSAVLGLFASKEYANLLPEEGWQVFHNGDVRFSPCYPLIDNEIALPTPSSWHFAKGEDAIHKLDPDDPNSIEQYNADNIGNHAQSSFNRDEKIQYKQCRTGYLTSKGKTQKLIKGYSTKTAINRELGAAKKAQLFSYSYIEAEQNFIGWVDVTIADQVLKNSIENKLKQCFQGVARIGRSRNTEFGRIRLSIASIEQTTQIENNDQLTLWCLSDIELINTMGMPTLAPSGQDIHPELENVTLNIDKSFIRGDKISRFNQKRQGLDTEQILISKGSILTFDINKSHKLSAQLLENLNNQGIGISKQQGLGWVSVNPAWANLKKMCSEQALFSPFKLTSIAQQDTVTNHKEDTPPDSQQSTLLNTWLQEKVTQQNKVENIQLNVNTLINSIISLYDNARKYNGIIDSNEAGPSSTQWRRVFDIVRRNNGINNTWFNSVFKGDSAIYKASNDELGWGINLQGKNGQTTFADEIEALLKNQNIDTMRLLLEQLCNFDPSTSKDLEKIKPFFKATVENQ